MGASQSSGANAGGDGGLSDVKTSYYELLGVERSASDDDIKKAYRKKALEFHPDRNLGDVERTTALFAQIQSAYEVLSDRQERAWYDAHEGDILRGGAGGGEAHYEHNMRVTTAEDIMGMLGKFSGKVDFSDSPSGFYGFLRDTFEQLAREEQHAADYADVAVPDYPSFGHRDDTYEDVVRGFYATWNGFATKKTFAWMDLYRLSEAPDRRVRRMMEKENKRKREDGIRDFNTAVRQLVLFVRRRDPRYTPNVETFKTAEEIAKAQRAATQAQAARSRAMHAAKTQEAIPEWTQIRDPDESEEEEELEIEDQIYECVACHKTFKSEKQYDAHEKSKKHQKAVQSLKRRMQKDNANLNLDSDVPSSGVMTPAEAEAEADAEGDAEGSGNVSASVEGITAEVETLKVGDSKDSKPQSQPKSHQSPTKLSASASEEDDDDDDEYASRSDIEARLSRFRSPSTSTPDTPFAATDPNTELPSTGASTPDLTSTQPSTPKLGAAAQKRAKKAAKHAELNGSDLKFKCAMCQAGFPSNTQLFQHIKDQKHAAPVTATKGASASSGGKKGKRK
ncbi:DnaJ-domain-containing protein [Melanomma pulvis-pyrius CBS 109.77]|uniref:DnaJ-domain-containing protein n=1 Tax=Melanomma pulvis-pyrius CBS 109.77 TaxID=1314802 RepID=A0A6A6XB14_9PLEO|nr:DnaJ-domain-containing protein [Melanomma pulvis-pyrius CBS 109.77]